MTDPAPASDDVRLVEPSAKGEQRRGAHDEHEQPEDEHAKPRVPLIIAGRRLIGHGTNR